MTELHRDYQFTEAAQAAGTLAELTPDAVRYEILRSSVMAEACAIRSFLAARNMRSLVDPYNPTLEAALATFDESAASMLRSYAPRDGAFVRGVEVRLMDFDDQWSSTSLRVESRELKDLPIGIFYACIGVNDEVLVRQLRYGIVPERDHILTSQSFYLPGSDVYKAAPDTDDLAYIRALLLDAQGKPEHVEPMRSAALWAAVEEMIALQLPE